ncbi:PAS domain-containing hybrid sensor histidine kinase/response regulator [Halomonas litopenaei]|uniref:PAS domain-containing hybrid sensor histidine kinase/response regulator n=1 Tax=Halomonas litopenaei TaxID=2109328 RepID=UPI001A8CEA1D|nr:PAS domain-containing hybrid sensor histidine kinase/response regulator [Halomonas litopenaei]MBN8413410.1 response regulator [Halomonas litopenaei]
MRRSEAAREEAEAILERRSRELLQANEQLMLRESELQRRLDRDSQFLLRAQRTARIASFHRDRGRRLATSPEFHHLLGLAPGIKPDEQTLISHIHPLDRDRVRRQEAEFHGSAEPGIEHGYEFRILRHGETRWMRWNIIREDDEHGRFKSLLGTVQDITEQRASDRRARALALIADRRVRQLVRLSKELQASRQAVEEAFYAKADFLAAMSHDIRTPLNGLLGMIDLLSLGELNEAQAERLGMAREAAHQLQRHIEQIVDMAHADDGGPVASAQPVDLRRYFDTLLQFWRYGHERIGRRLRLELDGSVPEVLTTDPTRLRQLMDAFIERLGEGEAPISLRVTVQGDCLCIDIVSTATGQMLRERRDRRRALLQRWAAAIEADITPCQAEGVSGFTLRLPLRQEVSDAHYCVPAAEQQLPDRVFNEENRPRLLVVDDIETNRVVLCQMLEVIGCDSDIACDGREAVDKALSERFDGVLMDILMPRMSGLEAVAELRRQPAVATLPVVAITAHTNREELGELTRQGFSAALAKPVNRQQLAAILLELLDGERRRAEEHSPAVTGSSVTSLSPPGVEAMPSSAPAVDEEHFRAIFASLSPARRQMLLQAAVDDIERLVAEVVSAHRRGEREPLQRAAHSLKGVAGNFGAFPLMATVNALRHAEDERTDDLLKTLQQQSTDAVTSARELFQSLST